jgi:hypothetical protein
MLGQYLYLTVGFLDLAAACFAVAVAGRLVGALSGEGDLARRR